MFVFLLCLKGRKHCYIMLYEQSSVLDIQRIFTFVSFLLSNIVRNNIKVYTQAYTYFMMHWSLFVSLRS